MAKSSATTGCLLKQTKMQIYSVIFNIWGSLENFDRNLTKKSFLLLVALEIIFEHVSLKSRAWLRPFPFQTERIIYS